MQQLPLKVDFIENESIVRCFYSLYQQGNPVLKEQLENVIKIVVHIYHKKETTNDGIIKKNNYLISFLIWLNFPETANLVSEFLRTINRDFPQEFASIVSALGEDVTINVHKLFV